MPTRGLPALPVAQISCANFGHPVFTNSLRSSHTETTAHSCQPTARIHSPTLPLRSHIPFAIQKIRPRTETSLKLTTLTGLINWTAVDSLTQVRGWARPEGFKWTGKGLQPKALGCNRAQFLARAKYQANARHYIAVHTYFFKSQRF